MERLEQRVGNLSPRDVRMYGPELATKLAKARQEARGEIRYLTDGLRDSARLTARDYATTVNY